MDHNTLINEWEISRTIDEISFGIDNGQINDVMNMFTIDCKVSVYEDGNLSASYQNRNELKQMLLAKAQNSDLIFHNNGTRVIRVQSLNQAAIANTTCVARVITKDPKSVSTQFMEYTDHLIRVTGSWYIVERKINILSRSVMQG